MSSYIQTIDIDRYLNSTLSELYIADFVQLRRISKFTKQIPQTIDSVELLKKCKDRAKTVKKYTVEDLALDC